MDDGRGPATAAAPCPTALVVERRSRMGGRSSLQCACDDSSMKREGNPSLIEVLIQISADEEDGAQPPPSPSNDLPASPRGEAPFHRRKRPFSGAYTTNGRRGSLVGVVSEGNSICGGSEGAIRSEEAEERQTKDARTYHGPVSAIQSARDPPGDVVASVGGNAPTVGYTGGEEQSNQRLEANSPSIGPITADGAFDAPPEGDEEEEDSGNIPHWPVRGHEHVVATGRFRQGNPQQRSAGTRRAKRDAEASEGRPGRKERGDEQSRCHTRDNNDQEECVVACRSRQQQQQQQQQTIHVVVHEVLSEDFGLFTWPSGVVLACLVWARKREFRGLRVVEIGAGTALPGLLAAKLGAAVALTDREGAPWVLENIRGAVAANGLAPDDAPAPAPAGDGPSPAAGSCADSGMVLTDLRQAEADAVGGVACTVDRPGVVKGPRSEGKGKGRGKAIGGDEAGQKDEEEGGRGVGLGGGGGKLQEGKCVVQELSWGSVRNTAIELAREQWCPQVVLGADVFYSSEHFDDVLATAYMLLSASAPAAPPKDTRGGGGDRGCRSTGAETPGDSHYFAVPRSGDHRISAAASSSVGSADVAALTPAAAPSASASTTSVNNSTASLSPGAVLGPTSSAAVVASTTSSAASWGTIPSAAGARAADASDSNADLGSPFGSNRNVFLTAYQDRSARRSLRPLLRKWGMRARVLHDAPQQVLPPSLWESGRYDSVALLEITLAAAAEK